MKKPGSVGLGNFGRGVGLGIGLGAVLVALLGVGCGPKRVPVVLAPEQAAARVQVRLGSDAYDNTTVELRVRRLTAPPAGRVYVVWVQPEGREGAERLAGLQVDTRGEGRLATATVYRRFELWVTAEEDADASQPGGPDVLRATVQR